MVTCSIRDPKSIRIRIGIKIRIRARENAARTMIAPLAYNVSGALDEYTKFSSS